MPDFNFLLLHVEDAAASATFYNELLGIPVLDQKPGFAMLPLRDGVMLGLWGKETVEPESSGQSGGQRDRLCRCRRRGSRGDACRLEAARSDYPPDAHRDELRHHFRSARSRWASAAGVRTAGGMI